MKPKVFVCVSGICECISCSVTLKLAVVAEGTGGQVIAELVSPILQFAESYPFISTFTFMNDCHFLIIVPIDFRFLPNLIHCRPMVECKPIIIILSCTISNNMLAEGIRGQL